jgi:hypothetical protein
MKSLALVLAFISTATLATPLETVDVVNTKYKNLFVFKVKNKFKGADVRVFYSNGDLVTSQKLEKKKMIINFCDVKYGTYTIKVQKGNKSEEFNYIKK